MKIETLHEINTFLRSLPQVPMQPLCIGSPFLQSYLDETASPMEGGSESGDVILTVRSSEKHQKEDRHLKYILVNDIFEVCAVTAYPTAALYPPGLRRACADELRYKMLSSDKLLGLISRTKIGAIRDVLNSGRSGKEDIDSILTAWFSKVLDKPVQYEMQGKKYRVSMI